MILDLKTFTDYESIEELLIMVDTINGFLKKGALADPYIMHITPECRRLIIEFLKDRKKAVAFIRDSHSINATEFKKFPVHCLENSWESEVIDELKPFEKDSLVFKKNSRSFMFAPNFIPTLEKLKNLKRVVEAGCCTDLCDIDGILPMVNYFDEMNRDVEIIVPENAVETYDAPNHNRDEYNEIAFKLMRQEGIKLVKRYGGER